MRIALVYRSFHLLGSLARETVELARHLSQRHEVHVFSIAARTDPTLAPDCTFHDVPVETLGDGVHFSVRELMAFGPRAAQLVMQERFDVVHVCSPSTWVGDVLNLPGVAPGEAALRGHSHARFVAGALRRPGNAARWLIERRAVANPALRRIHVPTARVLADVQRYYGIAADRILVVPPGVNLAEFRATVSSATARKDVPLDERRVVLLFCGSDFERKGLDRAIEMLVATEVDAELLVVGSYRDEDRFRRLASTRGVGDRVHFLGSRSDVARYYRAADILLLPTRADIWGATPIEAMAMGIPSIVAGGAGSASVVHDTGAGIALSEPFDAQEFRQAVERLARDPVLRRAMGEKGMAAAAAYSTARRGQLVEQDLLAVAEEGSTTRSSRRR
jgi:glycosyltransferase involved in cell wall biosynthesis